MSDQLIASAAERLFAASVRHAGDSAPDSIISPQTVDADGSPNGHDDSHRGRLSGPSAVAADHRLGQELATALGEHAALITHAMDRWFDHALSQIERISSRLEGDAAAARAAGEADTTNHTAGLEAAAPVAAPADPIPPPQPLQGTAVARFSTAGSWAGWSYHQAAILRPGGTVEIRQNRSTPGIVSNPIAVVEGGLFRLVIEAELAVEEDGCRLHARLVGEGDAPLGPDMPLAEGSSEIFLFVPSRTRELKLYLIVWQPKVGYAFAVRAVTLERIDIEAYYEGRVRGRTRPAIASLATIPSRRQMLGDCIASLLMQCDKVRVFLNGYDEVPSALAHPRIEIRRSQDWDDKGDAGKFGWLDCEEEEGYRIIADDDLIFPVDFADKMTAAVARYENRAIAGVHGILLKQPVTEYYDPESRSAFFFQSPLARERTVHVLGTGALCYHTSAVHMRWSDFMFRNMADVFLARYAKQRALPMVVVERPHHWVRQNTQEGGFESIYDHSLTRVGSRFNSALVQDAVIKWMQPWTLQPSLRPKIVLAIVAASVADFELTFGSWYRTRWLDFDWVVMVTAGVDDEDLRAYLAKWKTDHEMHVIDAPGTTAFERVDRLLQLAGQIGFQAAVLVTGRAEFIKGGWTEPAIRLLTTPGERAVFVGNADALGATAAYEVSPGGAVPTIAMFNAAIADVVGGLDPACGLLGNAFFDWMARAGRASRKPAGAGGALATIAESLHIEAMPPDGNPDAETRRALLAKMPTSPEPAPRAEPIGCPALTINEVFERVLTINLDRRPDRWAEVSRRLGNLGIRSERFSAIDGRAPEILAEYEAYKRRPLTAPPQGVRPIGSSREFFLDYDSQTARVGHAESSTGAKAIQSGGAWGYLKSWEAVLEQALRDRPESLLVFDDDVILHHRTNQIFAAAVGALPTDWLILQLGTLQYHWGSDWVTWRGPFLYSTNGSAIGSHAIGLRFEVVPFLLDHIKRMELPFDTGPLAAATRELKDRCFVVYPNIAIQSLADSDIGTSDFQKSRRRADAAETYRWNLTDYAADRGFQLIDKTIDSRAQITKIVVNG
jgi:GR25 family glycosyltransferase involved in LPS biosynthesis